ncbi:A-kinase anchor protein 9 isoform X3 [Zeugodacus cucurbitae]|uniref:A-kinase anchor protein 9 isoform X3 n=1 Tax=Zeugodacus cucurbitae TaxID=28588 RepID=UPI0005968C91|nr:A-kinase anchor protein 9 isoform X3 [Zeugodacus cucurbitae]
MPKIHITSLLRPRGHLKPIEDKPSALSETATEETAEATDCSTTPTDSSQQLETGIPQTRSVEFIPTLDFVIHEPVATELDVQHVVDILSQLELDTFNVNTTNNSANDDDDNSDIHSGHTYVINRISSAEIYSGDSTKTEELLRQQIIPCNSTDTTTESSLVYEQTSSISIEMNNLEKSATTATTATTTTTPTTTDEVPETSATTSRKNSNPSAITTATTSSSGEQSIEEEIEEAIEISEEDAAELSGVRTLDSSKSADYIRPISTKKQQIQTDQHFGEEESFLRPIRNVNKINASIEEDEQFKIDDDQLSGGNIAQHFVLDEDDDDDDEQIKLVDKVQVHSRHETSSEASVPLSKTAASDSAEVDFDDLDVSLPLEKRVVHSPHDAPVLSNQEAEPRELSLSNESTANDVSDFVEEPRQGEDSLKSEELLVAEPDETQTSCDNAENEVNASLSKSLASKNLQISATSQTLQADGQSPLLAQQESIISPARSEQDHSIEEIVERNHSLEYTLDDRDLSSLNPSFILHNETLVNRLLTDTVEEQPENLIKVSNMSANLTKPENEVLPTDLEHQNLDSRRIVTDLDAVQIEATRRVATLEGTKQTGIFLAGAAQNANSKETEFTLNILPETTQRIENLQNVPSLETKFIERKLAVISETLQLQGMADIEVETLETVVEQVEDDESSTCDINSATNALRDILNDLLGAKNQVTSVSPELEVGATEDDDDDDTSLELMKLRILAMKHQTREQLNNISHSEVEAGSANVSGDVQIIKPMERVPLSEYTKDVLEDITEESERNSLSTAEEHRSLSMERSASTTDGKEENKTIHAEVEAQTTDLTNTTTSIVSLNMLQMLENKVTELQDMVSGKDACLAALNLQLETAQRRESSGAFSAEQLGSGRDTNSSLVTSSTEYRTFQEEFGGPTMDIYMEVSKRDELIAKLTDSLQQSMNVRENLQMESDKLANEVQLLRKQLTDALDTLRRPNWPRTDLDSNYGQRISEISMDLISESDDDLERHFFTDNEDKYSRNSRERQLSVPRQTTEMYGSVGGDMAASEWSQPPFSKQIEHFQKYLNPNEVRLFFMVQKKFDDYLCQELEKCKIKCEHEQRDIIEKLETEQQSQAAEMKRLINFREEQDKKHAKEVEELRKYFETKCAELEKQFSDDVFSQKSQHHPGDTSSSEGSDQEQLPEDRAAAANLAKKEISPRKRARAALLLSPSHRQITPITDAFNEDVNNAKEITELKAFYQQKLQDLQRTNEEQLRNLTEKLKYYEVRYPDDEFLSVNKTTTTSPAHDVNARNMFNKTTTNMTTNNLKSTNDGEMKPQNTNKIASQETVTLQVHDSNTSLIIIDQDELNLHNESQVIQKIIEEYEKRLQEQLTLAREDIVRELETQIQTLLSETTTDDQHWPPELILLREKFTAKSQLKIAQLQIKHEEEMSRLKMEYEKQLNRKNKRNSTFDSARNFEQIITDRDNLRDLCKTFRSVLAELAKCVVNCEEDINTTLLQEVQRLMGAHNRTLDEPQTTELDMNISFLNASLSSNKQSRCIPDVHNLLELVEDPSLVDFVTSKSGDEDFDLRDCLERLNAEALYLLHLSEELSKRQRRRLSSLSSGLEKIDSCCEGDSDGEKSPSISEQIQRFVRTSSLNEQNLPTYKEHIKHQQAQLLNSLPPDLNRLRNEHSMNNNVELFSTPGGNASELNFQVHELKNRLVKSETDRVKLQEELEHTIQRNSELGQELQALRDQLSQLNSLNNTDYAEGYGHGSLRSPPRAAGLDRSSSSFTQLQEKARNILSSPMQQKSNNDATVVLLQMIEDFCREGEKVMECGKKDRDDLQSQIDAADKQLKATRHFLEEQAAEREQERDEFQREIERLKTQLRDKEKERNVFENASKEAEQLETQIRELTHKLNESNAKREKFEVELKASIDKIFVLREIITELETQVEHKALNEHVLSEKNKQLEDYINTQTRSNETLQHEVQSLKVEIGAGYQERIRFLEEKLQNMRPSAEQSMVLDQVVEQLRDIENTLDQKTKTLESVHHSISSNTNSATEDVSVNGAAPPTNTAPQTGVADNPATTAQTPGSPLHPSPRQHSLTMEGVQRIADKVAKHTRVEEAAVKRIRDLEMQVTQMRDACVELQHDRETLQERMSEQNQRISTLQSRLEEQRKRAMELQRAGSVDFNVRIHDLQTEVHNLRETVSVRDKQIATMKQQLEKSKLAMDRLEAELAVEHQPDRSAVERLETELKQKNSAIQLLKEKIKNEMINKLALPDLMETMLADKNEEIDHLREQLDSKDKEIQELNSSQASSLGGGVVAGKSIGAGKDEMSTKLSAHTLSDIVSISEFDEPDLMRRAAVLQEATPIQLADGNRAFGLKSMDTSKQAVANLTHKRSEDLSGFATLRPVNTFDNPHYFQDPNVLTMTGQSAATATPPIVPRQINFSALTEDSKLKTPVLEMSAVNRRLAEEKEMYQKLEQEVQQLKEKLTNISTEKEQTIREKDQEMQAMEEELVATQVRLGGLQHELEQHQTEISELKKEAQKCIVLQTEIAEKTAEIELLLSSQERLTKENKEQQERLSKGEKELLNYKENEQRLQKRITELQEKMLQATEHEVNERESLRKELRAVSEIHEQCKNTVRELETRKLDIVHLNEQLKAKEQRLQMLTNKLVQADENATELQHKISTLEEEVERLRQQPNSDNSSKQYSVDEIAQQVEKELNYSVQLDSNILQAIESEEENNLDRKSRDKASQEPNKTEAQGTDDENFTGERELLNQLEALKAQIAVEREQNEDIRQDLLIEKQHSQEIQEQDVVIIEAMRKRLETALEKEDELHKLLDIERERCERVQTQLTAMQRAESRRNSLLLKSPSDSPRKSPRALSNDFESELAERLRSEIKLLTAQNERERERCVDVQRSSERERQRYENELQERVDYCEKLKREMEKLARDKDLAEQECEHLQERLTLQTQEIESLEARLATLQEAETRRTTRRDRQQKESVQLLGEIQEVKSLLLATEAERDNLLKSITQLRFDMERAAQREAKLAEALSNANMSAAEASVPQQFLQKMKEINALLAENTQENRQMAETVQFLVEERRQLQKKCEELESQLGGTANVSELEERCNQLLGRYLRLESHRKALVYQKRYLKISLQSYQESEQRALAALNGGHMMQPQRNKKKLFKTVALAVVAIQRIKYIGRTWRTGKRIVSKSVFTITQQKPPQPPTLTCAGANNSSCPKSPPTMSFPRPRERQYQSLKSPALVHDYLNGGGIDDGVTSTTNMNTVPIFDWPRLQTFQQ